MKKPKLQLNFLILFIAIIFCVQPSQAGKVVKVKGKKVYILLDPSEVDTTRKGDVLYLTTAEGKKTALIKVRAMKNNMVIAQLGKGKAKKGYLTQVRGAGKKKSKKRRREEPMESAEEVAVVERDETSSRSDMMWGFLGGFGQASQNVTNVVDSSGSSMAIKGIFDYEIFSKLGVRARLGLDIFSLTGSSPTLGDFTTDLTYLTIDFLVRYHIVRSSSFGLFVNAGMGIYSPMTTDLTGGTNNEGALDPDSISTTSLLIFGGGVSFPVSSWEIFIGADYHYFPPSEEVETNAIAGKIGVLFPL